MVLPPINQLSTTRHLITKLIPEIVKDTEKIPDWLAKGVTNQIKTWNAKKKKKKKEEKMPIHQGCLQYTNDHMNFKGKNSINVIITFIESKCIFPLEQK